MVGRIVLGYLARLCSYRKDKARKHSKQSVNKPLAIPPSLNHYAQGAKQHRRHDGWTTECLDLEINICRRHLSSIAGCHAALLQDFLDAKSNVDLYSVIKQCKPEISNKTSGFDSVSSSILVPRGHSRIGSNPREILAAGPVQASVNGHRALTGVWSRP